MQSSTFLITYKRNLRPSFSAVNINQGIVTLFPDDGDTAYLQNIKTAVLK
jgi:hypothetical protein